LPVLLQQGDEEVDGKHDIGQDLVISHMDVADCDTQAKDLLQLELYRRTDFSKLVGQILGVGEGGGELSGLGEARSKETWNLLDQSFGGHESVILLGELLDELLVFVELFQVIDRHVLKVNLLSTIDVCGISKDANGHPWPGNIWEFDGSGKTLVSLRVVVFQTDLQFDGLDEVAAFFG